MTNRHTTSQPGATPSTAAPIAKFGPIPRTGLAAAVAGVMALAGGQGVPPRAKPADYPVYQSPKTGTTPATVTATIAAAIVPADQVRKMFSNDVASNYVVVEVALYPEDGQSFEADRYDFSLKTGDRVAHAESAPDVVLPWGEKKNPLGNGKVNVTQEAGVAVAHTNDPYYGKRTSVGTYEGTTVSNAPPPPPPPSGPDPQIVETRLREKALWEGRTTQPIAGYLYFPQYSKKRKNDVVELQYSKQDVEVDLKFPPK